MPNLRKHLIKHKAPFSAATAKVSRPAASAAVQLSMDDETLSEASTSSGNSVVG